MVMLGNQRNKDIKNKDIKKAEKPSKYKAFPRLREQSVGESNPTTH